MRQLIKYILVSSILIPGVFVNAALPLAGSDLIKRGDLISKGESTLALTDVVLHALDLPPKPRKFEEFGDVNCEDEMARLDSLALELQNSPTVKGLMIFYGGRRFRGQLPKRGEAGARAARVKTYLVQRRGIPKSQFIVIDGGYKEEFQVEIWVVPPGAAAPAPTPTVPVKDIKFQKGKATARQFRCEI